MPKKLELCSCGLGTRASQYRLLTPAERKNRGAVDRLVHHSTILEMNVESYRRCAAQSGHAPTARKAR